MSKYHCLSNVYTVYIYMSSGQSYLLNMPCPNSVVPYRLWGFQCSRKYRKWGIDIGSSPIGHEPWRFCATSETPRRSKTKLVLQWFCWLLIYAWDSISTNQNACTHTHKEGCVLDLKLQATTGNPMALAYCKLMVFSVGANQVVGKRSNSSF